MSNGRPFQKVLIIRFSSLGDIVLTSLLVRCLKKQKGCQIHYLTKKSFAPLLIHNPYIDQVWTIENKLADITPQLKAEQFDLIIDLHKNLRSKWVRWSLWNVPVVSYFKANRAKWLAVYFKFIRFPKDHIAIRYLQSLKHYNITDDGEGLDFFIPEKDKINVTLLFGIQQPYLVLVTGAAHYTKRVPLEKLRKLVSLLEPIHRIILIGGKAEQEIANQLVGPNIISACGLLSINQSASIIQQAQTVIAPDTGMMHIAAALKKPIRSIWGSTLAEFGFWPFYGNNYTDLNISYEVKGLTCRPCARFGRESCPRGHFKCMMDQNSQGIAESV